MIITHKIKRSRGLKGSLISLYCAAMNNSLLAGGAYR